ncbi:hypothetical protein [Spongiibacter sp. UBA1325]|uniref:hypothetical protein n=1 Tax=Spongiibacter sp. UBA1325 TaxID=1947543 RepID=UPI00257C3332|nr:hypothetical protein [Spongiibacter sp. UBA1325]|tara:strand:+ start:3925 stop:4125 length:201 start_codon:yes stop_codon:yes gene_type:complete
MPTPTAQQMLDKYMEAELALLEGKSITWNGKTYTRENLGEIQRGRREWERRVGSQAARPYGFARFY